MKSPKVVAVLVAATVCLAVSSAFGVEGDSDPDNSDAAWSVKCFSGGNAQVDPIVGHGVSPFGHMHSFVGQSLSATFMGGHPENLEPPDLQQHGSDTACANPVTPPGTSDSFPDLSEYWAPSLRSTALSPVDWIAPALALIYYRDAGVDPDTIVPFDSRLSFIGGDHDATDGAPQPDYVLRWSCVADKQDGAGANELNFGATIPASCPKHLDGFPDDPFYLRLVVYFPNCLDMGQTGHTVVNNMWLPTTARYAEYDETITGKYKRVCPEGYTPIPQVQVGFRYPLLPNEGLTDSTNSWGLTNLKVSSDIASNQHHGVSAHLDFMSGWTNAQLLQLMKDCYWSPSLGGRSSNPQDCGTI